MTISFRIFISSPGDVGQERLITGRVIQRLQGEFGGGVQLEAVLWEHEPIRATESFQEQIDLPSKMDVVVCIFWSRLGTRLPKGFEHRPDGTPYDSGTAFEFEDAKRAYEAYGTPALLVYRKTAEPLVSLRDPDRLRQQQEQWEALEQYLRKWFLNEDESYKAGFTQFETVDEFEQQLARHLRRLIRDRVSRMTVVGKVGAVLWHRGSPFRGLEVFEFEHAPVFFGRTRAIGDIREALVRRAATGPAFVLLVGMSGSGKSSLIRAGVLPTLTHPGVIEGIGLWRWGIFRPSDAPADLLQGLAQLFFDESVLPELATAGATIEALTEAFKRAPQDAMLPIRMGLSRAAEGLAQRERFTAPPMVRLMLVVDQLEELFTLGSLTHADREEFIALLSACAGSGVIWVLGSLRSDFYYRTAELPLLVKLTEGLGQYHVLPPRPAEISQIIREPARAAGLTFEVDPVMGIGLDAMLEEAASLHPEVLPLLEFMLDELFKQRGENSLLTLVTYTRLGGLEGALERRAEGAFEGLSETEKAALPSVIRALVAVTPSDEGGVVARNSPLGAFPEGTPSRAVIDTFLRQDLRLFVADGDGAGARVRVAHEALFSVWERAREIILADRELLHIRQRVEMAAAHWKADNCSEDLLLPLGKPLAEAEALLCQGRDELSPDVIAYIETSRTVQHEKERREHKVAEREAEATHLLARRRQMVARARRAAFFCLFALLAFHVWQGERYWSLVRHSVFDVYQRAFPRQPQRRPVVVVDIDEASLAKLGGWPWPRTRLARLIDAISQLGAMAVGLVMIMPEPDRLSPSVLIDDRPDLHPALRDELARLPSNDATLAETLRRVPSVIGRVGMHTSENHGRPSNGQTPVKVHGEVSIALVQAYDGHLTNVSPIEEAASGRGYLNDARDADGVVRTMPLLVVVNGELAPTFALELLRVAVGEPLYNVYGGPHGVRGVQIGTSFIPTDPDARIRLYYARPDSTDRRRRISALAILNHEVEANAMANQVAIIGVTGTGLTDVSATPVAALMEGVEVQVQAIENVLDGTRLVRPLRVPWLETGMSLLASLLMLILLPKVSLFWRVATVAGTLIIIMGRSLISFVHWHILLDATFPVLTMVLVVLIASSGGEQSALILPGRHKRS